LVTVVLADDHVVVRQGLRALLEADPHFAIVGEAANGHEAIEMVTQKKPTVLITDLMMPGLDGLAIVRKLSRLREQTRVIILSMYGDQAYVLTALKNGAAAYVVKESCGAELFEALREVTAGRRYLSPVIVEASRGSFTGMGTVLQKAQAGLDDAIDTLSVRERKVLKLLVEGAGLSEISSRLKISSQRVDSYRATCMRKLGLSNPTDMINQVLQRGSLALDSRSLLGGRDYKQEY